MLHYLNDNLEPCTCSPEQVEEYLQTYFLDIDQSEPWRSRNTHDECCSPGNATESCQSSQSGMMSAPLTENHGEDELMLFAVDSLAKTYRSRGKEQESKASGPGCGHKCGESLAKYDHNSSSWKTHQCLLFEDSQECLEIFPQWGFTIGMEYWEAMPPAGALMGNASGFSLMRPIATDALRHKFKLTSLVRKAHADGNLSEQLARVHQKKLTPIAAEILMGWPEMWTDLEPLATANVLDWLHSHGEY